MVFRLITYLVFLFLTWNVISQEVWLHPNKGQWDERIVYSTNVKNGKHYIEKDGFTTFLTDFENHAHEEKAEHPTRFHVIKSSFVNANWKQQKIEKNESPFYQNYFIGKDTSKWKSNVYAYSNIEMLQFYEGIDLLLDTKNDQLNYGFRIQPNANPNILQRKIEGADKVWIDKTGNLHIQHSFGEIIESKPIAWTELNGNKTNVACEFNFQNGILSFKLNAYNKNAILYIDPSLTFSSFTGSISDNWGFTAAPDPSGNLFAGGIVMGNSYPLTTGAYDVSFNGGTGGLPLDVAITKFNATGTALLYSTFVGGSGNETVHSMYCAANGELFFFGVTSSPNFPMAGTPYDATFNGGPTVSENSLEFNGADLYVARLNANGSSLLASTYVGGSGTDGLNINNLQYNYGDQFRGEIVLDTQQNVYVASTTESSNFPVVLGMQGTISGIQDAVIFKMPSTLNSLTWSTFFGGNQLEAANSLQVSSNGSVYVAGGTSSNNLPISSGFDLSYNGGMSDGFLIRLNASTGANINGSYLGMNEYDQAYFVQIDLSNDVYVLGQSESSWPISSGVYGNANSGQFIQKFNASLSTSLWTTMIGAGTGHVEISPTAFLVSDCYEIYLSGWGGELNRNLSVSQAGFSTTNGFPVTANAFQASTNGSNFYIAVLTQNAALLEYGTYMGGTSSSFNHVDGGTSRFDKSGRIYHAVCGACGGNNFGFTTTPGVVAPQNPSSNCNLAAFKFELNEIDAVVSTPQALICIPDPVIFDNNSANGNTFEWNFGDGNFSNAVNPTHYYTAPGVYTVTLIVSDSNSCFTPDSTTFQVKIGDFQGGVVQPQNPICPGDDYQLDAFGGTSYQWTPAQFLSNPSIANPIANILTTTTFTVIISDSCGVDTVQVTIPVVDFLPIISNDTSICIGNDVEISVSEGAQFIWSPSNSLNNPNIQNPIATPTNTTEYHVTITSVEGCIKEDSVLVQVFFTPPIPIIPDTVKMCENGQVIINVSGADQYEWSPNLNINTVNGPIVTVSPTTEMYYYCDFINACATIKDSVYIDIVKAEIIAGNDTSICIGETATLWGEGAVQYIWSPTNSILGNSMDDTITVQPNVNTNYLLVGTDENGCRDSAYVSVIIFPIPFIQANPDVYAFYGEEIILTATSTTNGTYIWSPAELVGCVSCQTTTTSPDKNSIITVSYTDENGCSASDQVHIFYDPIIYVPNTFTPDGDEKNNGFYVYGSNVRNLEVFIFNRWGELIYTIKSFEDYWDGTYKGIMCQDGTYTWKLSYMGYESDEVFTKTGHINLIR